jgi:hypothetical protein
VCLALFAGDLVFPCNLAILLCKMCVAYASMLARAESRVMKAAIAQRIEAQLSAALLGLVASFLSLSEHLCVAARLSKTFLAWPRQIRFKGSGMPSDCSWPTDWNCVVTGLEILPPHAPKPWFETRQKQEKWTARASQFIQKFESQLTSLSFDYGHLEPVMWCLPGKLQLLAPNKPFPR